MPLAAFPTVPGILSLKHLISGNLQLGSSNKTEPMPRNLLRLSFAGRVPSFIPNNFLKSTAVSSSESSVAKLSSICPNANLEIMCLLINLAVIRLSLQIVIPGIMIVFRGSKKSRSIAHCCFVSLQQPSLPATGGGAEEMGHPAGLWHHALGRQPVRVWHGIGLRMAPAVALASLVWLYLAQRNDIHIIPPSPTGIALCWKINKHNLLCCVFIYTTSSIAQVIFVITASVLICEMGEVILVLANSMHIPRQEARFIAFPVVT